MPLTVKMHNCFHLSQLSTENIVKEQKGEAFCGQAWTHHRIFAFPWTKDCQLVCRERCLANDLHAVSMIKAFLVENIDIEKNEEKYVSALFVCYRVVLVPPLIWWDNENSLNSADAVTVGVVFAQNTEASLYAGFSIYWLIAIKKAVDSLMNWRVSAIEVLPLSISWCWCCSRTKCSSRKPISSSNASQVSCIFLCFS